LDEGTSSADPGAGVPEADVCVNCSLEGGQKVLISMLRPHTLLAPYSRRR
jgi:hypothetical protein